MNCQDARHRILLHEAGELDATGMRALEDHLRTCATCRAYRDETQRLIRRAVVALPPPEPGQAALDAVRARIRERAGRRSMRRFSGAGRGAVWAAAASAVLLFGWLAMRNGDTDHGLNRIRAVMALLDDVSVSADEPDSETTDRQEALRRLGRELLWSQGLLDFENDIEV